MFLKKIRVQNFCGFGKEAILDLNYDPAKCKFELDIGYLKLIDDQIMTPIIAISGANGVGKTSILEAIGLPTVLLDNVVQHFMTLENFTNTVNRWLSHIGSDFNEEIQNVRDPFKDYKFANVQTMSEFVKVMPDILRLIKIIHLYSDYDIKTFKSQLMSLTGKLSAICDKVTMDNTFALIKEVNEVILKEKYKFWRGLKRNKFQNTKIVFEMYDSKFGNVIFSILDNEELDAFYFDWKSDVSNVERGELWKKLVNYFANSCSPYAFDLIEKNKKMPEEEVIIHKRLAGLINHLGPEETINLLKVVDPNIDKLELQPVENNKYGKVISVINLDGTTTPIRFLSKGTKRFIFLLEVILDKIFSNNNEGFLIIDELESYFHVSITTLIKEVFYGITQKSEIQLFFSSHNPIILSELLSPKQIFILDKHGYHSVIECVANQVDKNDSLLRQFINQQIGSHPDIISINRVLDNILYKYDSKK